MGYQYWQSCQTLSYPTLVLYQLLSTAVILCSVSPFPHIKSVLKTWSLCFLLPCLLIQQHKSIWLMLFLISSNSFTLPTPTFYVSSMHLTLPTPLKGDSRPMKSPLREVAKNLCTSWNLKIHSSPSILRKVLNTCLSVVLNCALKKRILYTRSFRPRILKHITNGV